jgi:DNA-binding SARP family transcriptional activator/predicted ATPase
MLGQLRVVAHGATIRRFRTQKSGSLLSYLACDPRPHNRHVVAELLWPWSAPDAARHSLNQALSSVRAQVEPTPELRGSIVRSDRRSIGLVPGSFVTDISAFRRDFEAAQRAEDPAARAQLLLRAAELYAGPFLQDHYEAWVTPQRERLAATYARLVGGLVEHYQELGDLDSALGWAYRGVSSEPLDEAACRRLMRLLVRCGRSAQAVDAYRRLEDGLATEYQSRPAELTQRLFAEIQGGEGQASAPTPAGSSAAVAQAVPASGVRVAIPDAGILTFVVVEGADADAAAFGEISTGRGGAPVHGEIAAAASCAAFPRSTSAIACAMQLLLARGRGEDREAGLPRVALVTAEVEPGGLRPNAAGAKLLKGLLAAAQPGQVLVSESTALLARASGVSSRERFADLGQFRLGDMAEPARVFRLIHPDLPITEPAELLALRWLSCPLPPTAGRLIGREQEQEQLVSALEGEFRCVTLTGPPGVGKTRLAVEAARRAGSWFDGGSLFVSLQDVPAGTDLADAVLRGLGSGQQMAGPDRLGVLARVLSGAGARALLVLDAMEHMAEQARETIQPLLQAVPGLCLMTTSLRSLRLAGEHVVPVAPLQVPAVGEAAADVRASDSARLLLDRARLRDPAVRIDEDNCDTVAAICRGLDGVPLSLELAGARMALCTPQQLLLQLEERDAARRPVDDRARAAVEWVLSGASPAGCALLGYAAVFRGGARTEALAAVSEVPPDPELLDELVASSLLVPERRADHVRFRMLRVVQQQALAGLSSEHLAEARARHAEYFADLAPRFGEGMRSEDFATWSACARLEADNFLAAVDWGMSDEGAAEPAIEIIAPLLSLLRQHRSPDALATGLERLVARTRSPYHQAMGAFVLGGLAIARGDVAGAEAWLGRSESIWRRLGDDEQVSRALMGLAQVRRLQRDREAEAALLSQAQSVADASGSDRVRAFTLQARGLSLLEQGRHAEGRALLGESARVFEAQRLPVGAAVSRLYLGMLALNQREDERAEGLMRQALATLRGSSLSGETSVALMRLGDLHARRGEHTAARRYLKEACALAGRVGDRNRSGEALALLGLLAVDRRELAGARRLLDRALGSIGAGPNLSARGSALLVRAWAAFHEGARSAGEDLEAALELFRGLRNQSGVGSGLLLRSRFLALDERWDDADRAAAEALEAFSAGGDRFGRAEALCHMSRLAGRRGDVRAAGEHLRRALEGVGWGGAGAGVGTAVALLERSAELAVADDHRDLARRALRAAEGLRSRYGLGRSPWEAAQRDRVVAGLEAPTGRCSADDGLRTERESWIREAESLLEVAGEAPPSPTR